MQVVVVPHAMCQCTQHNMHVHWVAFDCSSTCLHRNPTGAACTAQQDTGASLQYDGVKGEQEHHHQPAPIRSTRIIRRTCGFRPPRYLCTFLRWPLTGPPAQTSGISDPERTHRVAPNGKKKTSKEAKGGKSEERRTHHRWFLGIMACAGMTSFVPTSCRTIPSIAHMSHVIIHFLRSTMRFILRQSRGLRSNQTLSLQLGWRTS